MRGDSIRSVIEDSGLAWRCEAVLDASGAEPVPVRGGSPDPERVLVRCVSERCEVEVALRRGWFGALSDDELLHAIERALVAQGEHAGGTQSSSR